MDKPNLATCTFQEAADYAVFKVVEQGGQCLDSDGIGAYSDGNGRHDTIGWLLPEGMDLTIREKSVDDLVADGELEANPDYMALYFLQSLHDLVGQESRQYMVDYLSETHGLDTSAPQYQQWVEMGDD